MLQSSVFPVPGVMSLPVDDDGYVINVHVLAFDESMKVVHESPRLSISLVEWAKYSSLRDPSTDRWTSASDASRNSVSLVLRPSGSNPKSTYLAMSWLGPFELTVSMCRAVHLSPIRNGRAVTSQLAIGYMAHGSGPAMDASHAPTWHHILGMSMLDFNSARIAGSSISHRFLKRHPDS